MNELIEQANWLRELSNKFDDTEVIDGLVSASISMKKLIDVAEAAKALYDQDLCIASQEHVDLEIAIAILIQTNHELSDKSSPDDGRQ